MKRLVTSKASFTYPSTINVDNVKGGYNFYFALKYEVADSDVWGFQGRK